MSNPAEHHEHARYVDLPVYTFAVSSLAHVVTCPFPDDDERLVSVLAGYRDMLAGRSKGPPPIVLTHDQQNIYDGMHRLTAARMLGLKTIAAHIWHPSWQQTRQHAEARARCMRLRCLKIPPLKLQPGQEPDRSHNRPRRRHEGSRQQYIVRGRVE